MALRHTAGKAQYMLEKGEAPNSSGPLAPTQLSRRAWGRCQDESLLFQLIFIWSIVALQSCVSFCCTAK